MRRPTTVCDFYSSNENVPLNTNESSNKDNKASGIDAEPAAELGIRLDQFLQTCGVPTGGQAKVLIQAGEILVNNEVETRRRRKLFVGDEVLFQDELYVVAMEEEEE